MIFALDIYEWILNFAMLGIASCFWALFIILCIFIYFCVIMGIQITLSMFKKGGLK
jgi:hypothetical protein